MSTHNDGEQSSFNAYEVKQSNMSPRRNAIPLRVVTTPTITHDPNNSTTSRTSKQYRSLHTPRKEAAQQKKYTSIISTHQTDVELDSRTSYQLNYGSENLCEKSNYQRFLSNSRQFQSECSPNVDMKRQNNYHVHRDTALDSKKPIKSPNNNGGYEPTSIIDRTRANCISNVGNQHRTLVGSNYSSSSNGSDSHSSSSVHYSSKNVPTPRKISSRATLPPLLNSIGCTSYRNAYPLHQPKMQTDGVHPSQKHHRKRSGENDYEVMLYLQLHSSWSDKIQKNTNNCVFLLSIILIDYAGFPFFQ